MQGFATFLLVYVYSLVILVFYLRSTLSYIINTEYLQPRRLSDQTNLSDAIFSRSKNLFISFTIFTT